MAAVIGWHDRVIRCVERSPRAAWLLPALACLLLGPWAVVGCGDSCEELGTLCRRCLDPNQRLSCQRTADADDADGCELGLESFDDICE